MRLHLNAAMETEFCANGTTCMYVEHFTRPEQAVAAMLRIALGGSLFRT